MVVVDSAAVTVLYAEVQPSLYHLVWAEGSFEGPGSLSCPPKGRSTNTMRNLGFYIGIYTPG